MQTPRVSVVMNCRNGAAFLHEALDSLVAQTFQDWELIAWDDASSDDTCTILRSYTDSRFHVFAEERGTSLSGVRQAAVQACRGEWIAFLDQDDLWLPTKLAQQLALADEHPDANILYARTLTFSGQGRSLRDYDHRHAWKSLPEGDIFNALFEDSCFICMSSAMLRTSSLRLLPPMPAAIRLTPDYHYYLSLARDAKAYAVQQPACLYRQHAGNVSKRKWVQMHEECLQLIAAFSSSIDPALAAKREGVHQSLIAFGLMLRPASCAAGAVRLVRHGSAAYFFSRPFVRIARMLKLAFVKPYWQQTREGTYESTILAIESPLAGFPGKAPLLGTGVSVGSFAEAQGSLCRMVEQRQGGYVCNANVFSVMLARSIPRLRRSLAGAAMVIADGMPIVWLLRLFGWGAERVHGDDLFFACCASSPTWRHFLLGGRTGQDKQVEAALRTRYPDMQIVGTHATPTRPLSASETERILQEIADSKADVVWIGMGTPMQDYWMRDVTRRLPAAMVGVGSAFDLLSGRSRQTPQWMKKAGLQWLFRIAQEPRRLAKRYLYYNTLFLCLAGRELIRAYCMPSLLARRYAGKKPH